MQSTQLKEGAEHHDLARLVQPSVSIDEYRSKMGEDKDIVVLGLTIFGDSPAEDLVSFLEKSYDFVLDADVSSGETSDGNYMVFIELARDSHAVDHIFNMFTDLMNLTGQSLKDWTFTYYKDKERYPFTKEELAKRIILSSVKYDLKTNSDLEESIALNHLRSLSGVTVKPRLVQDLQIINMQIAAGIK